MSSVENEGGTKRAQKFCCVYSLREPYLLRPNRLLSFGHKGQLPQIHVHQRAERDQTQSCCLGNSNCNESHGRRRKRRRGTPPSEASRPSGETSNRSKNHIKQRIPTRQAYLSHQWSLTPQIESPRLLEALLPQPFIVPRLASSSRGIPLTLMLLLKSSFLDWTLSLEPAIRIG